MVWHGHIKNGTVVVDGSAVLPDGGRVKIELIPDDAAAEPAASDKSLGARLLDLAGQAQGLPSDAAANHDDYVQQSISQ